MLVSDNQVIRLWRKPNTCCCPAILLEKYTTSRFVLPLRLWGVVLVSSIGDYVRVVPSASAQTLFSKYPLTKCHSRIFAELHNVNVFTQTQIWVQNLPQKTRKSRLICFRDKMRKIMVCLLILQFKGSCFFQLQIFTTTYIVFGFNRWFNR